MSLVKGGSNAKGYTLTEYINDINRENTEVLAEYGADEKVRQAYTYGESGIGERISVDKSTESSYYLYDGRNSVTGILTETANLTKRQLLCFGAAALIGVPIFFLVKATGNVSLAALSMMIVMLPLFFLAMYEKDSQPLEVVVEHFIQTKFVRPKVRPYQTDNYYDALMRQYKLEKEVERIVFQKEATGKKHQNACKSESEAAARN